MARGPLEDMPEPPEDDEADETPEEESEEAKAGNELKDALDSGDGQEIFDALEHCYNVVKGKGYGGSAPVAKPGGILAILEKSKRKGG